MNEETKRKVDEYIKRNHFWTGHALNQLGYSVNLFTTIGIGFLGYLISTNEKLPTQKFCVCCTTNWTLIGYYTALAAILLSIVTGFISILSRLGDFRITRHLSLMRKRFLAIKKDESGIIKSTIPDTSTYSSSWTFIKNTFFKTEFINRSDFTNTESLKLKFDQLRAESTILGHITWNMHRLQIILFFFSILLYFLVSIKK